MLQVQDTDAETRFAEILRTVVEEGETVVITRDGKQIARIQPPDNNMRNANMTPEERRAAVDKFIEQRKKWGPTGITLEEILAWRHEGHRY